MSDLLENFYLKWANPLHFTAIAFTDILMKPSLMCKRGKQIFDLSSKAGCAIFLWLDIVSEGSDHFFYCVVAVPRQAVQFTLKKGLVYPLCSTVSVAVSFRAAHIFYRCFSCGSFFYQHLKFLLIFFHMICMSQWDRKKLISIVE